MITSSAMGLKFLALPVEERRDIISAASPALGLLPSVLEKDVWVCWVLDVLFSIPERRPMVFKGGTSLSKVFNLIERFSEDIDISINFLHDYSTPISKTKASDIRPEIEANLQIYKAEVIVPALVERSQGLDLTIDSGDTEWEVHVNYVSTLLSRVDYLKTRVKIELSGRNETEPSERRKVGAYLAQEAPSLEFPEATIDALLAERTFWEKVTLVHAELHTGRVEKAPARMSRHWSDLAVLMKSDVGQRAIEDGDLCLKVVNHKDSFWRDGKAKYDDCRNKKFRLVPSGKAHDVLKADYEEMLKAGMFFGALPATFDEVIKDVAALESVLNK